MASENAFCSFVLVFVFLHFCVCFLVVVCDSSGYSGAGVVVVTCVLLFSVLFYSVLGFVLLFPPRLRIVPCAFGVAC